MQLPPSSKELACHPMRNLSYNMHMQDKANAVGYMVKRNHILCTALSVQGERGPPTKKQKQMPQHAVHILKKAQKVASHRLREFHEKTESEDEEDEQTNARATYFHPSRFEN